ncbi:hypothetical protein, partial [Thermohalobaculum xanthum]|uniref:hypothetical protein n=1 Tax=Thermohalobaculum xanthum TaxID=2753746 RepID=UPI001F167886
GWSRTFAADPTEATLLLEGKQPHDPARPRSMLGLILAGRERRKNLLRTGRGTALTGASDDIASRLTRGNLGGSIEAA